MAFRMEKFNQLLSQKLSEIFFSDFANEIITINFINTTKDLSESKIFISVSSEKQSIYDRIESRSGIYRKILADELEIRKVPKLIFVRDEMYSAISRVEEIIEEEKRK